MCLASAWMLRTSENSRTIQLIGAIARLSSLGVCAKVTCGLNDHFGNRPGARKSNPLRIWRKTAFNSGPPWVGIVTNGPQGSELHRMSSSHTTSKRE